MTIQNKKNMPISLGKYLSYLRLTILGLLCGLSSNLLAEETVTHQVTFDTTHTQIIEQPLWDFMQYPTSVVDLRTSASKFDFFIPVSSRFNVTRAELKLKFTNSISLLSERSQLVVKLNDSVIAQLPLLRPETHNGVDVSLILPHSRLRAGYNKLSIGVVQHYTLDCEDPSAPELWTQIDTKYSLFSLQGVMNPVHPILSDLDDLIAPSMGNPRQYNILMTNAPSNNSLSAAAITAQAVGLRLKHQHATFNHKIAKNLDNTPPTSKFLPGLNTQELQNADNILIGTADELSPFLSEQLKGTIKNAYLGIFPLTENSSNFILVISGQTEEQLIQAAKGLSKMTFPFPDAPASLISHLESPLQSHYSRRLTVDTETKYKFSNLNYQTRTISGITEEGVDIAFDLPADFYTLEDKKVKILLNFAYGAKLRSDSVLNIYLNNVFEKAIALRDKKGAVIQGYEVSIPFRSFNPGKNKIRFEPAMVPRIGGECIAINDRHLQFTLYDTSTIDFPYAAHYTTQPNLKLFSETAFPYQSSKDNDSKLTISVLSKDNKTLSATWMLLAKLAQVNDALLNANFMTELPVDDQQLIVISPFNTINPQLFKTTPMTLNSTEEFNTFYYPVYPSPEGEESSSSFFAPLKTFFSGAKNNKPNMQPVRIDQTALPVKHGLVTAFESPFASKHTVTLFTAETPDKLFSYMKQLVTPKIWSQMSGDVVLWTKNKQIPVHTQQVSTPYYVGTASINEQTGHYLSSNPWALVLVILILIFLLAWVTHILLNRRFLRRHGSDVRVEE